MKMLTKNMMEQHSFIIPLSYLLTALLLASLILPAWWQHKKLKRRLAELKASVENATEL